jgi:uncharacterized membrane protein SpoIIM required for sporulation
VQSGNLAAPHLLISIFAHNLLFELLFIGSSLLHLGLVPLVSGYLQYLFLGNSVAWFTKYPGTSAVDGVMAYAGHATLELFSSILITAVSLWIGFSVFKPDQDISRWETIKKRYRKALPVIPLVAILLFAAAVVETAFSLPHAYDSAQQALVSERTKEWSDPLGEWKIQVPESWKKSNFKEEQTEEGRISGMESPEYPIYIDVRTVEMDGVLPWSEAKEEIAQGFEPAAEMQGLKMAGTPTETTIAGQSAMRMNAMGKDITLQGREVVMTAWIVNVPDETNQKTVGYGVYIRTDSDWYDFSKPLLDKIVQSFQLT